ASRGWAVPQGLGCASRVGRRDRILSLQGSVLAFADGTAEALGLLRRPLQGEALRALARRRSGFDDFGDTAFVDPLQRLLAACADQAPLNLVGRRAHRWDGGGFLRP